MEYIYIVGGGWGRRGSRARHTDIRSNNTGSSGDG